MVVGKVTIIKTRLPGPQKFAGSARTLLRSTRLCHQISATATDCIQAIAILWASALIPHRPQGIFVSIDGKYCENDALEG